MAKEKGYTKRADMVTGTNEKSSTSTLQSGNLIFGKKNYIVILAGVGLMFLGLILMSGGHMPSPDVWDESLIYSPIRITLAPILILTGLLVNVYAIFVKK